MKKDNGFVDAGDLPHISDFGAWNAGDIQCHILHSLMANYEGMLASLELLKRDIVAGAIATMEDTAVGVVYTNSSFFIFDSHSRTPAGRYAEQEEGLARLFRFEDKESVADYLFRIRPNGLSFDIAFVIAKAVFLGNIEDETIDQGRVDAFLSELDVGEHNMVFSR